MSRHVQSCVGQETINLINNNISHKLLRPSQFLEKFLEILEFRSKSGSLPLINDAACWNCSNTEACAKKWSRILANNTDNGRRGIGLRIYVRYCLKKWMKNKSWFEKIWHLNFRVQNIFGYKNECFWVTLRNT